MRRVLFDPMNLPGGFSPADIPANDLANIATLYRKRSEISGKEVWNKDGPWVAQVDDYSKAAPVPRAGPAYVIGTNGTLFGPQGNCRLSADGLGRIMLMLLNQGKHDNKQILKSDTVKQLLSVQWRYRDNSEASKANGESTFGGASRLFNAWGLGAQHFTDTSSTDATGKGSGDRLAKRGGFTAFGHLGDAWGLTSAMVFNPESRDGMVYLIGGPGVNPDGNKGQYSGMYRHEEQILDALYEGAVRG
jgi:hypothetical protein